MELIGILAVLAFLAVHVDVAAVPSVRPLCVAIVIVLCVLQLVRLWI